MSPPSAGSKNKTSTCFILVACSSEMPLIFNGLHGVISQRRELLITTAVRASNPTKITLVNGVKLNQVGLL
jgi:hypothetical protein